jgi:sugar-specific transcriptional regulator TrmB
VRVNLILINNQYSNLKPETTLTNDLDFFKVKSLCPSKIEGLRYLTELGLTRTQANLYLSLMLYGEADARLLASLTSLPRTEVYRSLNELQEKGLVDKILDAPLKFSAVPPSIGLQGVIDAKFNEIVQMQDVLKEFEQEYKSNQERRNEKEYKIRIIDGRKRIMAKIKEQHDNAKSTIDIVTFLPRFLKIAYDCEENYRKASERGVKYRIIIGLPNENIDLPDDIKKSHLNKNTLIKTVVGPQRINTTIFDREQTSFSFYPDKPIMESPMIVTNHPFIVEFSLNSFEQMWKSL